MAIKKEISEEMVIMSGEIEKMKMHPSNTMFAGWSPALQMYVMNKRENYSFCDYSDYYEISEDTYNHFCDEGFEPEAVRLLFSGSPLCTLEGVQKELHDRFYGIK